VSLSGNLALVGAGGHDTAAGEGAGSAYVFRLALPINIMITSTVMEGSNLVFSGKGGIAGDTYYVLTSTNIATRMTNWVRVATNVFGDDGTFSVTNAVEPSQRRQFFRLQVP
jgi:hypothetical protein